MSTPKRQIFFDTETTGLNVRNGDRMAQFAGVEAFDGVPSGKVLNLLVNPDREIDAEASAVNGLTWDMLRDKPRFRDVAPQILSFIEGAELIAHKSSFDEGLLQAELERISHPKTGWEDVGKFVDTLPLARRVLRGQTNKFKLDHLLDFYGIDRSMRDKHDALLDCQLLIPVYQRLVEGLDLSRPGPDDDVPRPAIVFLDRQDVPALPIIDVSADASARHDAYLRQLVEKEKVEPVFLRAKASSAPKM